LTKTNYDWFNCKNKLFIACSNQPFFKMEYSASRKKLRGMNVYLPNQVIGNSLITKEELKYNQMNAYIPNHSVKNSLRNQNVVKTQSDNSRNSPVNRTICWLDKKEAICTLWNQISDFRKTAIVSFKDPLSHEITILYQNHTYSI
jgi:hypothetical protein